MKPKAPKESLATATDHVLPNDTNNLHNLFGRRLLEWMDVIASVAANKIPGIRAGLCHDTYSAHQGVEHDHMNVLVLGGRVIGPAMAHELVLAYVNAKRSQEERHLRRLAKVHAIEERYTRGATQ